MDLRVQTIIEIVLKGFLPQFDSPARITELPQRRKTREERARGLQTAIEDLFQDNGDSFNGFSLIEGARHHKLEQFASVTGKHGPRGFDVTLRDDLTGGIVLIELKWTTTRNAPPPDLRAVLGCAQARPGSRPVRGQSHLAATGRGGTSGARVHHLWSLRLGMGSDERA